MKDITLLFKSLGESVGFVIKNKLYLYFIPAIFLSFLFYLGLKGGQSAANWLEFMEDWWVIGWIIKGLEKTIHVISFVLFEFVILVLLTPINSYFSEKVKESETGIETKFDFAQLIRSLGRSLRIVAVAFTVEILALFFIWILSFFLGDWFYYITALVISSYFLGFSFYDFGLDLENVKSKASWKWGKQNKWLCLVTGLIFSLTIYIPEQSGFLILFIITISFIPHLLTIAATKVYYSKLTQKKPDSVETKSGL